MVDLDALREAYRGSRAGGGADHLSEDQWERLACDELGTAERQAAMDHILECTSCSDTCRALQILRLEAAEHDDAVPESAGLVVERRVPWRGLGLIAVAASVAMVVVLPLRRAQEPSVVDGATVVRSTDQGPIATPVAPVGEIDWERGEDLVISWIWGSVEGPGVVEILDVDGEPIWISEETSTKRVVWPGGEVPGSGRFYWRVVVGGASLESESSDLAAFDLVSANPP